MYRRRLRKMLSINIGLNFYTSHAMFRRNEMSQENSFMRVLCSHSLNYLMRLHKFKDMSLYVNQEKSHMKTMIWKMPFLKIRANEPKASDAEEMAMQLKELMLVGKMPQLLEVALLILLSSWLSFAL